MTIKKEPTMEERIVTALRIKPSEEEFINAQQIARTGRTLKYTPKGGVIDRLTQSPKSGRIDSLPQSRLPQDRTVVLLDAVPLMTTGHNTGLETIQYQFDKSKLEEK